MTLPTEVDWMALSPEARDTLQQIALRISLGFSHAEIGDALGISQAVVGVRLLELREEIRAQGEGEPAA